MTGGEAPADGRSVILTTAAELDRARLRAVIAHDLPGTAPGGEDQAIARELLRSLQDDPEFVIRWTGQEQHYLNTHPADRWLPYLVYRYKMTVLPRRRQAAEFPVYVLIEPVSACNLRCVMCFQADPTFTTQPFMGTMQLDLYRRIIDEAQAGGTQAVTLASRGEPTLHPQLPEMLAYAAGKFIDLKLNTNATLLSEKLAHAILQSDVNELVFSVDGADKATYEAIRIKGNFDEVVANIERFHRIRARHYPAATLRTRISGVLVNDTQDAAQITAFWRQRVDDVVFVRSQQRWDTYHNAVAAEPGGPCGFLWRQIYIWYNGVTSVCDVDYKSVLSPGNVQDSSIRAIWNGPAYTALRQDHLAGRRAKHLPCDRCGIA